MNTPLPTPGTAAAESPRTSDSTSRRWWILAFLMALCFISHFNRASITSAGDERIMAQFQISPERMGMVYSAFLIVYTIFMIPGGWLIDRRGPRFALGLMGIGSAVFCVFTGGIGFGLIAATQVWFALLVVRAMMGLMTTPLHPGAARAAGGWFAPEQRSLANGLITGASILAYAVVHPVFGGLVDRFDWPVAFVFTGAVTAVVAIAWMIFAKDAPKSLNSEMTPRKSTPIPQPRFTRADRRNLLAITLSYSAIGYFQYIFFYWLHYYFASVLQMEKTESRYYAGLPNLAMAACMPLGGWLSDRAVRWRGSIAGISIVPKIGMILSALFLLGGIFATERLWIVTCFTASLGVLGLCEASFWTVAVSLGRERGGTWAAIMNTGGNGIGLLAPIITPLIAARLGWEWGLGLGALVAIAGGLCWFAMNLNDQERDTAVA